MSDYVKDMATVFDGFRLDNCHNTPLHVAKYMVEIAKKYNPNLFIKAELFADSRKSELKYVNDLKLNALIRELQHVIYNLKYLAKIL